MAATRFGKFELVRELGRGPLGKVYAATDGETGQLVVFRGFRRPEKADDTHWGQAIQRFHDELSLAKNLAHPNIAKVYEFGEMPPLYYIVTEYFEGRTLRQLLDSESRPTVEQIVPILRQVCQVIDYATGQRINHGDFTPYNVLVLPDGTVKVINYGLAHTRNRLGSPYLAPEQLTGAPGDHRSDFFSLGSLTYELLTGAAAFRGETVEQLCRNILGELPAPMMNVPPYLQGIVRKMLAKDPRNRYASGSAILADLRGKQVPAGFEGEVTEVKTVDLHAPWAQNQYQPGPCLAEYRLDEGDLAEARERIRVRRWRLFQLGERITLRIAVAFGLLFLASTTWDVLTQSKQEVALTVMSLQGSPQLRPKRFADFNGWIPIRQEDWVNEGDMIRTKSDSSVTLRTRDGTRIKIGPNTKLEVQSIQYKRKSASKVREFALHQGRIWARVRGMHGKKNTFSIAAAGGEIRVTGTDIGVTTRGKGEASFSTFAGSSVVEAQGATGSLPAGKQLQVAGGQITGNPRPISPEDLNVFKAQEEIMQSDPLWASIRQSVVHAEESVLLPVIAKVSNLKDLKPGDVNANYFGQLGGMAKAMTAMRAITIALEGDPEYPDQIDLQTLAGIGLEQKDADRILKQFDGHCLLSYQRLGNSGYEFTARADTKKKELLRARNGQVEKVESNESSDNP